jgi:hypothetical protein
MSELRLALLPILLAMLISPARTIAIILLLHTPKKALTAFAYICGMIYLDDVAGAPFRLSPVDCRPDPGRERR